MQLPKVTETCSKHPNISLEIKRLVAVAECTSEVTSSLSPTSPQVIAKHLATDLVRSHPSINADALISSALSFLKTLITDALESPTAKTKHASTRQLQEDISSAYVKNKLYAAYYKENDHIPTEAEIERIKKLGFDGEAIIWAVVIKESYNHIGLVFKCAHRLSPKFQPVYTAEDLFGWGWAGLRTALRKYDPTTYTLSTYAMTRISGAIMDGVRQESSVPKRMGTLSRRAVVIEDELTQKLLATPTLEEISKRLDTDAKKVGLLPRIQAPLQVNDFIAMEHILRRVPEMDVDDNSPLTACINSEQSEIIHQAMLKLEPSESQVIQLVVFEALPLKKVQEMMEITSKELKIIRTRAMSKLTAILTPQKSVLLPQG